MELLLTVLKFIELKGFIRIFHDKRSIELGDAWRQSVEKGIQEASIVICLLSPQYFASEFVMSQELPLIQKRQKDGSLKVLPVLLKDCLWEIDPWWASLQMLRDDQDKHLVHGNGSDDTERVQHHFVELARQILRFLPELPEPPEPPTTLSQNGGSASNSSHQKAASSRLAPNGRRRGPKSAGDLAIYLCNEEQFISELLEYLHLAGNHAVDKACEAAPERLTDSLGQGEAGEARESSGAATRRNLAPLSNTKRIGDSGLATLLYGAAVVAVGSCAGGTGAGTFIGLGFVLTWRAPKSLYYADRDWGMIALEAGERSGLRVIVSAAGPQDDRGHSEALLKWRECSSSSGPITSVELGRDLWRRLFVRSNEELTGSFCAHALGVRCDISELAEPIPNRMSFIEVRASVKAEGPSEAQARICAPFGSFAEAGAEEQLEADFRKDQSGFISLHQRESRAELASVSKTTTHDVSDFKHGAVTAGKDPDGVDILDLKQGQWLSWEKNTPIDLGAVLYEEIRHAVCDARPILGHPEADRLFKNKILAESYLPGGFQRTFTALNENDTIRAWREDSPCYLPRFVIRPELYDSVQACAFDTGRVRYGRDSISPLQTS